ncbi:MAG TPA: SGNH/GDSL hydrolase family protein [Phycisphaerae bacterium]|nr:SGNH/GDSL hydrolase family protein [Phycisphaerae bacterium]
MKPGCSIAATCLIVLLLGPGTALATSQFVQQVPTQYRYGESHTSLLSATNNNYWADWHTYASSAEMGGALEAFPLSPGTHTLVEVEYYFQTNGTVNETWWLLCSAPVFAVGASTAVTVVDYQPLLANQTTGLKTVTGLDKSFNIPDDGNFYFWTVWMWKDSSAAGGGTYVGGRKSRQFGASAIYLGHEGVPDAPAVGDRLLDISSWQTAALNAAQACVIETVSGMPLRRLGITGSSGNCYLPVHETEPTFIVAKDLRMSSDNATFSLTGRSCDADGAALTSLAVTHDWGTVNRLSVAIGGSAYHNNYATSGINAERCDDYYDVLIYIDPAAMKLDVYYVNKTHGQLGGNGDGRDVVVFSHCVRNGGVRGQRYTLPSVPYYLEVAGQFGGCDLYVVDHPAFQLDHSLGSRLCIGAYLPTAFEPDRVITNLSVGGACLLFDQVVGSTLWSTRATQRYKNDTPGAGDLCEMDGIILEIHLGMNDFGHSGGDYAGMAAQLADGFDDLLADQDGRENYVVVTGMGQPHPDCSMSDDERAAITLFNQLASEKCRARGVVSADYERVEDPLTWFYPDGVHPTELGASAIASYIVWRLASGYDAPTLGNLDCDTDLDMDDVCAFDLALLDPDAYTAQHPDCYIRHADCNFDGVIDGMDVEPFVNLLIGE